MPNRNYSSPASGHKPAHGGYPDAPHRIPRSDSSFSYGGTDPWAKALEAGVRFNILDTVGEVTVIDNPDLEDDLK